MMHTESVFLCCVGRSKNQKRERVGVRGSVVVLVVVVVVVVLGSSLFFLLLFGFSETPLGPGARKWGG